MKIGKKYMNILLYIKKKKPREVDPLWLFQYIFVFSTYIYIKKKPREVHPLWLFQYIFVFSYYKIIDFFYYFIEKFYIY